MMEEKSNFVRITGSEGSLFWESNNNPRNVVLYSREGMVQRKIELPVQINGYEYEGGSLQEGNRRGRRSVREMPHGGNHGDNAADGCLAERVGGKISL